MKKCYKCQEEKDEISFSVDKNKKSGLASNCKNCRAKSYEARKGVEKLERDNYRKTEQSKQWTKDYNERTKEKRLAKMREYNAKNKEKIKELQRKWNEENKNKPLIKISRNLRRRLNHVLNGNLKADKTFTLLGCTAEELKIYLESLFLPGMTWENYGPFGWHIDHILPCASFDLTSEDEQRKCFHYSNLQPLWWQENIKKGCKV